MKDAPPYVAAPAAAKRLGVPLDRIIMLIREGALRARLVGGARWFVERVSLEAWLRTRRRGSRSS